MVKDGNRRLVSLNTPLICIAALVKKALASLYFLFHRLETSDTNWHVTGWSPVPGSSGRRSDLTLIKGVRLMTHTSE